MITNCLMGLLFTFLIVSFPYLSTPLSMGCCLLITTIMLAFTGSLAYSDLWLSYILVLVFLGGVLVIFIYVALVSSNEQFSLTLKPLLPFILALTAFFMFSVSEGEIMTTTNSDKMWLKEMYSENLYILTLFLVLYLFLTLIVVVSNTSSTKMTLRSF